MVGRTNAITSGKNSAEILGLSVTDYSGNYDGSSHTITASVNSAYASIVTFEYSTDNETWSQIKPYRIDAGTTTVYVRAISEEFDTAYDSGSITIRPASVTLTANSAIKSFNGSAQSVTGYVASEEGISFNGVSASGSGTTVGSYTVSFSGVTVNTTVDTTGNYVVTDLVNGTLTIQALAVTATITLTSDSYTYNGSARTLTYEFSSSNSLYTSSMCTISGGSISRTDAGSVTSSISAKNNNTNFNVTFDINNGTLTINPASVTLTATSGTKTYTGSSQSVSGFTSSVSGLSFSGVSASGSGTSAGSYTVSFSGATVNSTKDTTGNYVVKSLVTGTLTINPASVTLTASSGTKTYTGSSQSVTGFTSSVSGLTFSGVSASGSGTNAGSYTVSFSGATVNSTKDSTGNYVVTSLVTGTLTISKAAASKLGLTVTSYSGYYDGSAHTVTAKVTITSGTTIQYSTNNSTWVTTAPTRTEAGTTTVYVRAVNNNYNTATATGTITINQKATLIVSWANGQYCSLFYQVDEYTDETIFSYQDSGYWSGTPTKTGLYWAMCSNADPSVKSVNVTSTTSGTYTIAW